jgi:alpha-L-arabinofuranosidase
MMSCSFITPIKGWKMKIISYLLLIGIVLPFSATASAGSLDGKKISPDSFGLFFEDINYSADGGLYAALVRNRSVEYIPTEQRDWNPLSFREYISPGFSYGTIRVETSAPVRLSNPHFVVLVKYNGLFSWSSGNSSPAAQGNRIRIIIL